MKFIFLSQAFYDDYPEAEYSEIMRKATRPHIQTYVEIEGVRGVVFAVPLRSHINHPHVLWTDEENRSGLDFSKAVVITNKKYIDTVRRPVIRQNEFEGLRGKEHLVEQKLLKYIRTYKKAKRRLDVPRNQDLCAKSTLQYFEKYI